MSDCLVEHHRGAVTPTIIDTFVNWGFRPLILDTRVEKRMKGGKLTKVSPKILGKAPRYSEVVEKKKSLAEIVDAAQSGMNIGFRLPDNIIVIDVDPRNGGIASFDQLKTDTGIDDYSAEYPVSYTGGGGWHVLLSKNPETRIVKNPKTLDGREIRYPGIDFLSGNVKSYIVGPGSYHYLKGRPYEVDEMSAWDIDKPPHAPDSLMGMIGACSYQQSVAPDSDAYESLELPNDRLVQLLADFDAPDFGGNDEWLSMAMACHHMTGGAGYDAFSRWSATDPKYANSDEENMVRWRSFDNSKDSVKTHGHILQLYADRKNKRSDAFGWFSAIVDLMKVDERKEAAMRAFDDAADGDDDDDDLGSVDSDSQATARTDTSYEAAVDLIKRLNRKNATTDKLEALHGLLRPFDKIIVKSFIRDIAKKTQLTVTDISDVFRDIEARERREKAFKGLEGRVIEVVKCFSSDPAAVVVAHAMRTIYKRNLVINSRDKEHYQFNGKFWEMVDPEVVESALLKAAAKVLEDQKKISPLVKDAAFMLSRLLDRVDLDETRNKSNDIFALSNCEVWIDHITGQVTKHPHRRSSRQTICFDFEYDPAAECPIFDKAVSMLFENKDDQIDIIRHLWELYGYTLTSNKNIPAFVNLIGNGGNGKSVLLEPLINVLGQYHMSGSIFDVSSTHGAAMLVNKLAYIDDDAAKKQFDSAIMKKYSESKWATANEKYKSQYSFRTKSLFWIASNSWPYVGDSSDGIVDRAHIFHCSVRIRGTNREDRFLKSKLRDETSGIFNAMLNGLMRFRDRGGFDMPRSLVVSADDFRKRNDPVYEFLANDFGVSNRSSTIKKKDLVEWYINWSLENNQKNRLRPSTLIDVACDHGFIDIKNGILQIPSKFISFDLFEFWLSSSDGEAKYDDLVTVCDADTDSTGTYSQQAVREYCRRKGYHTTSVRKRLDTIVRLESDDEL